MTPAQSALILAALGLTPRDGVMPRWSSGNGYRSDVWARPGDAEHDLVVLYGWMSATIREHDVEYHVTRRGAEAAGVLGRCRREDLGHG